jgi:hypothetical protein
VSRFGSSIVERREHHCTIQKGDKAEPGNYRPVSLTSVICKTMDKLVRKIIVKHMSANSSSTISSLASSLGGQQPYNS